MNIATTTALGLLLIAIAGPACASPGQAVMTWQSPEKFTDIEPGNGTKRGYHKAIQRSFNKELAGMAAKLPDGYTFEIDFTDIDLAGEIDPVELPGNYRLRLLKEVYFPSMRFNYRVLDASGAAVAEQKDVRVTDMSFLNNASRANSSADFYYETRMLKDWFGKNVLTTLK